MRWEAIRKVWPLCKLAFPNGPVWPDVPHRLSKEGGICIYDIKSGKKVGEVKYKTINDKINFSLNNIFEDLKLERKSSVSFDVKSIKTSEFIKKISIGKSMSANYSGEKLLDFAEKIYANGPKSLTLEQWLLCNEFPDETIIIAEKKKYKEYQRVRIKNTSSMEYNEMGVILDISGDKKKGFNYLVLVDGSEKPIWFNQSSLNFNLSGALNE